MRLTHACLITTDVARLKEFYRAALSRAPSLDKGAYVEFRVGDALVSMWDLAEHLRQAPGTADEPPNRALILEFEVDDVDAEHERIKRLGAKIAKPIATQEWGNRSFYFLDPDGNLVNFYTRVR
jgi:catechol 2,3-dioxygenase-like lactoylglutathione lyase family enzyme